MHLEDPLFPPLLKGHAVRAPAQPMAEACRGAQSHALGAGDIVWSRNTARATLAIVLEPDVALERALQMAPLLMVALGDCLGALCPPQVAVQYRWPRDIVLNGTVAGGVRIAAPRIPLDQVPAWLVVGADLEIAAPQEDRRDWSRTSLAEEAGPDITRTDVLQSVAAHFMTWLHTWQEEGFRAVHDQWLFRALGRDKPMAIAHGAESSEGRVIGLDEGANLLLEGAAGKVRCVPFLDSVDVIAPDGEWA
jgi:BirA family transcriptional regulator, biotin operon repressor / biotin---[acetyl-CoA-carboxylase] ligase